LREANHDQIIHVGDRFDELAMAQESLPATSQAVAAPAEERVQAPPSHVGWIIGAVALGGIILLWVLDDEDDDNLPASP
jgi:hypothetical protein